MELRSRSKVSGPKTKPRDTSLGRGLAERHDEYSVAHATIVSVPSSPMMTTRDGEFSSRVSPYRAVGLGRASVPSVRSESAGRAIRSPEGAPPRRSGKTWEHGDVGGAATYTQRSSVAAAVGLSGAPTACPDEGANFTLVTNGTIADRKYK